MKLQKLILATLIAVLSAGCALAQSDFFFSFDQGGENADQKRTFNIGDSGSLWVYWSTNGPADSDLSVGAFIDVFSSNSGVIEFTGAETFDYDLLVNGAPSGLTRLNNEGNGPIDPANISPDMLNEFAGFTVTGRGILEENNGSGVFLDDGYTAANDGFEWGRIDFNVIGAGSTTITAAAGDGMIVNGDSVVDAAFNSVTVNTIPEPTAAGLLGLAIAGLACRRRR